MPLVHFPDLTTRLRASIAAETELFFDSNLSPGRVPSMVDGPITVPQTSVWARHYGIRTSRARTSDASRGSNGIRAGPARSGRIFTGDVPRGSHIAGPSRQVDPPRTPPGTHPPPAPNVPELKPSQGRLVFVDARLGWRQHRPTRLRRCHGDPWTRTAVARNLDAVGRPRLRRIVAPSVASGALPTGRSCGRGRLQERAGSTIRIQVVTNDHGEL